MASIAGINAHPSLPSLPPEGNDVYIVQPHEGLIQIAERLGVDWHELARLNGLSTPYTIHPGQVLQLPEMPTAPADEPLPADAEASTDPEPSAQPTVSPVDDPSRQPDTSTIDADKVDDVREDIHNELNDDGAFDVDVTHGDLLNITDQLQDLSPAERNALIEGLSDDDLERWTGEIDNGGGFAGSGLTEGLNADERRELHEMLAQSLDGEQLSRVYDAYDQREQKLELAGAVAEHGSAEQKLELLNQLKNDLTPGGMNEDIHAVTGGGWMPSTYTTTRADAEGVAMAELLGSLGGNQQALDRAYGSLTDHELSSVFAAATDRNSSASGGAAGTTFDGTRLAEIIDAAATSNDIELRTRVFTAASEQLEAIRGAGDGVTEFNYSDGAATEKIVDAMTRLLKKDVHGLISELEKSDQYGGALVSYLQTMVASDKGAQIGELIAELGQDVDHAVPVENEPATDADNDVVYPNAQLLGYFSGATQAAILANGADAKQQGKIVQDIFLSVLDVIPGASTVRGAFKGLTRTAVNTAAADVSQDTNRLRHHFYELIFPQGAGAAEDAYRSWEASVLSANR